MRITKSVPERRAWRARRRARGMKRRRWSRAPRRGWEMGPLCHRKYREAACPEIRAYFSFCPAITAAPRLHGRAATNMGAAATTAEGKKVREGTVEGTTERTHKSEWKEASGWTSGGFRGERDPISYSSCIPLDLPAFLLHLPLVRICFIYISYFPFLFLFLFLFLCRAS